MAKAKAGRTDGTNTTDKAAAERILARRVADAALRRDGVIDAKVEAIACESRRTIESHLADYEAKLRAANRKSKHISSTLAYIRAVATAAGWATAGDITTDGLNTYASSLKDRGRSARTVQAVIVAVKAFTRWLTAHHKLPADPLALVAKPDPRADRKRERRMLLPEEWQWLRAVTADGAERFGMTGAERVLLYATAIQTGLRAGELSRCELRTYATVCQIMRVYARLRPQGLEPRTR